MDLGENSRKIFEFKGLIVKIFRNKGLRLSKSAETTLGSFEDRLDGRMGLETAPITVSIIARSGLVVNGFLRWFVMKVRLSIGAE